MSFEKSMRTMGVKSWNDAGERRRTREVDKVEEGNSLGQRRVEEPL
jgi:hypothetical protein